MSQDARYDEEQSTQRRADVLNFNYYDTSGSNPKSVYNDILSAYEIRNFRAVPITADRSHIMFGILTTTSPSTINMLKNRFQDQLVSFAIISETGFKEYVNTYDPPKKIEYKEIELNNSDQNDLVSSISSILEQVNANDMLAYLVEQAHKLNASDIHIETKKDNVLIRFRIDGVLHSIANLSYDKYRILISAIASAGNISTSSREPQQGHIYQKVKMATGAEVDVNLRLETVQTINSMDVVMRLFNMDRDMYNLDRLGLNDYERKILEDIISKPSGLVMVVGPTGSGKTTTLYSMINALSNEQRKIITIEDPVEYQLNDITQISITPEDKEANQGFADKLKAILRLDPDIVMVGEIRDNETAKTALQAALTGHLVLTTFHAGSAASALSRLYEIIGQNPLFVSSIRLVMAQRLVRRLDDQTKQEYVPNEKELARIREVIDSLPDNIEKPDINNIKIYKAVATDSNPFGYQGQIAVREQFLMTDNLSRILNDPNRTPSTKDIEEAAFQDRTLTMIQDGMLKVLKGETTLEEFFRLFG